ncbi:hypothetical protein EV426DRAFT_702540 [Tirmania nivea]|nr:hypothetical protein EV426DRAFT_702540 [Tirmania nivea]
MKPIVLMILLSRFGLILPSPPPRQSTTTNETRIPCGFDGDSDTYGLGIRIGVYTQWASGVIANWYVTEIVHIMRVRATLFQMAMAIALAFITIRKPRPYAVGGDYDCDFIRECTFPPATQTYSQSSECGNHQMLWNELHAAFKRQISGDFWGLLVGLEGAEANIGEPAPQETVGPKKNPPWWKPAIAGAVMLLAIIAVELVITGSWNNIQGVNTILSTGQLIPFVIGIGGLAKICFRWWQLETVKKKVVGPAAGLEARAAGARLVGEKKV